MTIDETIFDDARFFSDLKRKGHEGAEACFRFERVLQKVGAIFREKDQRIEELESTIRDLRTPNVCQPERG